MKRISLNQVSFETSESFIENFILSEKNQRKEGWQSRVKGYEELLKKHKLLRRIYQNENITIDFVNFKREKIDNFLTDELGEKESDETMEHDDNFVIDKLGDKELDEIMRNESGKCILF